jgi:hypothetical protein
MSALINVRSTDNLYAYLVVLEQLLFASLQKRLKHCFNDKVEHNKNNLVKTLKFCTHGFPLTREM